MNTTAQINLMQDGENFSCINADIIRTAADLSALATASELIGQSDTAKLAQERLDHLATGAFVVAIVGEFKRGKSTLANALLGVPVMLADVMPATATINRIIFGRTPAATLLLKDGSRKTIPIEILEEYVTKTDEARAARAALIAEAVISYPTMLCRQNVELLDTPGLEDDAAMTEYSIAAISKADAAIMVTSVLAPFADSEAQFLDQLVKHVDPTRLFFVLNRIDDLRTPQDVDRVAGLVRSRIRKALGETKGVIRLYPVSARQALAGKLAHDANALAASQFDVLERELERFLVRDRGVATLQIANEAVVSLGRKVQVSADTYLSKLECQDAADATTLENLKSALSALTDRTQEFRDEFAEREMTDARMNNCQEILAHAGEHLAETARRALMKIVFFEDDIDCPSLRHAKVEEKVSPSVTAAWQKILECAEASIVDWVGRELAGLRGLADQLAQLSGYDRVDAGTVTSEELVSDLLTPLQELQAVLTVSYVPSGIGGSVNSLFGEVVTNNYVKDTLRWFGGKKADDAISKKVSEVISKLYVDYEDHLDHALHAQVARLKGEALFIAIRQHLKEKLWLKITGDTDLVISLAERKQWEIRIQRERIHGEHWRERERIVMARDIATRAVDAAQVRANQLRLTLEKPDASVVD